LLELSEIQTNRNEFTSGFNTSLTEGMIWQKLSFAFQEGSLCKCKVSL